MFHNILFPEKIAYGTIASLRFATEVAEGANGAEFRNIALKKPRQIFTLKMGAKNKADLQEILNFFRNRAGRAYGFLFKNIDDFFATGEMLAIADGITSSFQLTKTYDDGTHQHIRNITKPKEASLRIYLDGVLQTSGYTLEPLTGIITFDSPPANEVSITADYEFFTPVRFNQDEISYAITDHNAYEIADIQLIEIF